MKRKITIGDKTYTLTATRNIIKTLYEVSPEILSMATIKDDAERMAINAKVSVDIVAGLDKIFYELIKVAQPTITFEKSVDKDGKYICACCGKKFDNRIFLQVDHIKPMNKGGLTTPENLQILCRECNGTKGDK